jgi:hypothetical protein
MPLSPGDGGRKVHHIQLPPTFAAERAGVLRGTGSFSCLGEVAEWPNAAASRKRAVTPVSRRRGFESLPSPLAGSAPSASTTYSG